MLHIMDELNNDGDRIVKLVTEDLDQLNIEINNGQPVTSEYVDGIMYYHRIQEKKEDTLLQPRIVIENPLLTVHPSDKFLSIGFDSWNRIFCTCYAQALLDSDGNINIDEICRRLKQG